MAREYFCAYHSYLESMRNLTDAECGRLFRALLQYSAGDKSINLQGRESIAFDFVKVQIDRDEAKYEDKCEQARSNRNGRQQTSTDVNGRQRASTDVDGRQRTSTGVHKGKGKGEEKEEIDKETPYGGKETVADEAAPSRPSKQRHGSYGHVFLTADEFAKLHVDYANADDAIAYLDEYIELKGYKAKSHYLALRKWVFDALKEDAIKKSRLAEQEKRYGNTASDHGNEDERLDFDLEDIFEKPTGRKDN